MAELRARDPATGREGDVVAVRDVARHPIRRAAALAHVHPQTLREYERRGLLRPDRTAGGMRLYRDRDVDIARRVRELTDDGYAFDAVRRVVGLERRIATLVAHIRVLEDQNVRLSTRLSELAAATR
jgi:DNA-binding transcriptional MerR regulator